jgi:hypothetical protein
MSPTFCKAGRQEVIDITPGEHCGIGVSSEPSLSDHRHIQFIPRGSWPVLLIRNPRGTDLGSFREDPRMRLEKGPGMIMGSKAGLALSVHSVQQALISYYENNCPPRPVRRGRSSLKLSTKLEALRREISRLFNRRRAKNEPHSLELYREAQRSYRKEVCKAFKETWRSFCSPLNDLPRSARLHRALSRDPKNRLGSLVAPTGGQSEGETLDLLLNTHFPDSAPVEGGAEPAAICRTTGLDWRIATRIITYRRVEWAINSFALYKSPGMDGIFPALLQSGREILIPYLLKISCACLATGYVPAICRQVKVVFIPKPGRSSYCGPKDFRPISLTLFLLKPWRDW